MVMENAGAGTGRHVIDLAAGLISLGWEVHLAYSVGRIETGFAEELKKIDELHTVVIPMERAPGWRDFSAALAIRRYMSNAGPFVLVHGHSSKGGALARIAAIGSGVPAFYTPHAFITLDPGLRGLKRRFFSVLERCLSHLSTGIFCVSRAEGEHANSLGIRPDRILVVPNGITALPAASKQSVRGELGIPADSICFGFVGRLAPQKSVDNLIDAFRGVATANADALLLIVGDGPDSADLRRQVEEASMERQVKFLGQLDGQRAIAAFDVFVLASIYEGFPYVLLEAAAREMPILMTDVGGAYEMATYANARVVPIGDIAALAESVRLLLADSQLREAMADASRSSIATFISEHYRDRIGSAA